MYMPCKNDDDYIDTADSFRFRPQSSRSDLFTPSKYKVRRIINRTSKHALSQPIPGAIVYSE